MSSEERAEELAAELWADNKFQGWWKDFADRSRPAMLAALRAERLAALEEAARECENDVCREPCEECQGLQNAAARIRALKNKPEQSAT